MKTILLPERTLRINLTVKRKRKKTTPECYLYWIQEQQKKQWE